MDSHLLKGQWNVLKGKLKQKYGELTDDDLTYEEGQEDELFGRLQNRTGQTREALQRDFKNLTNPNSLDLEQATTPNNQYMQQQPTSNLNNPSFDLNWKDQQGTATLPEQRAVMSSDTSSPSSSRSTEQEAQASQHKLADSEASGHSKKQ